VQQTPLAKRALLSSMHGDCTEKQQGLPPFTRLPKPGQRCPISGLSRTTLVELIAERKIQAKKLRKRGSLRGVTLVLTDSLIEFLTGLEDA